MTTDPKEPAEGRSPPSKSRIERSRRSGIIASSVNKIISLREPAERLRCSETWPFSFQSEPAEGCSPPTFNPIHNRQRSGFVAPRINSRPTERPCSSGNCESCRKPAERRHCSDTSSIPAGARGAASLLRRVVERVLFLGPRGGVVAPTKCGKPGSQVYWAPWLRSERRAVCRDGFRSRSARLRCSFCSRARSRGGRRVRPRERRCEGGQVDELREPAERALCLRLVRVVHSSQRRGLVPPSGSSRRWTSPRRGIVAPTSAILRSSRRSGDVTPTSSMIPRSGSMLRQVAPSAHELAERRHGSDHQMSVAKARGGALCLRTGSLQGRARGAAT